MKKIALMTWHHVENYGTAYQAYALKTVIEEMGACVDLVSYKRKYAALKSHSIWNLFYALKQRTETLFSNKKTNVFKFKDDTFKRFYDNNFRYTDVCESNQDFNKLNDLYDGFVCGSDQIWGPEWFDGRYFLDFVNNPKRLIAYAPSIGVSEIPSGSVYLHMRELIGRYNNISLRESTGCDIVSKMLNGKKILNVLDPVLLLSSEKLIGIEEDIVLPVRKYCFIFFLANNPININKSIEFANNNNLIPCVFHCTQSEDNTFVNTEEQTPGQLLRFIKNADYICTDSFHFAVLSIIYKKNFTTFRKYMTNNGVSKNNRITDLLNMLLLNDREYEISNSIGTTIDYQPVFAKLQILQKQSLDYLKKAIESLPPSQNESKCLSCWENKNCSAIPHIALSKRIESSRGIKLKLLKLMETYPFALHSNCYRCSCYSHSSNPDGRKPQFYERLINDLIQNKSIYLIFFNYYLAFWLKDKLKKWIK